MPHRIPDNRDYREVLLTRGRYIRFDKPKDHWRVVYYRPNPFQAGKWIRKSAVDERIDFAVSEAMDESYLHPEVKSISCYMEAMWELKASPVPIES